MKFYFILLCILSSSSTMAMHEEGDFKKIAGVIPTRPHVPSLLLDKKNSVHPATSPRAISLPHPLPSHSPLSPRPSSWSCSSLPTVLSPRSQSSLLSPSPRQSQRHLPRLESILPGYWQHESEISLLSPWGKLGFMKFKNNSSPSVFSSPSSSSEQNDDRPDLTVKSEEEFNGVLSESFKETIQHLRIDFMPSLDLLNQALWLPSLKYLYLNFHLARKASDPHKPSLTLVRRKYLTLSKQDVLDLSPENVLRVLQRNEEILPFIEAQANMGIQAAQYVLGQIYENHQMISEKMKGENETNALLWYKQAEGNAGAQYNLARYYLSKANSEAGTPRIKGWREEAFRQFRLAAAQGHRKAQFRLAGHYLKEQISESALVKKRNEAEVFKFLRSAAEQGHTKAQAYFGWMYVNKNISKAVLWLQKAADKGHLAAQYNLAMIYKDPRIHYTGQLSQEERTQEAFRLLTLAAERNLKEAYLSLGDLYYENQALPSGVSNSERMNEAWRWFQRAAEEGEIEAKFKVALMFLCEQKAEKKWFLDEIDPLFYIWFIHMYPNGVGEVPRENDQKIIRWLKKAIKEHTSSRYGKRYWQLPTMQFALGWMYMHSRVENGKSKDEHDVRAVDLLSTATSQGLREAEFSLGKMYWEGRVADGKSPENDFLAFDLFKRAAEKDLVEALFYLGEMHWEGRVEGGLSIDNRMKAIQLYNQATEKEFKKAENKLKTILQLPM